MPEIERELDGCTTDNYISSIQSLSTPPRIERAIVAHPSGYGEVVY